MASKFSYTPNEKAKQHSVNYHNWIFSRGDERKTANSYAGTDISASLTYGGSVYSIPGLQTVTLSSHTARVPIRPIGMRGPRGFATGSSTYAGTIIMVMDKEDPLITLMKSGSSEIIRLSPTRLPPFNVILTYQNEYNQEYSVSRIWNARIVDHGQTASVNDLITEMVYQYIAEDYDVVQLGSTSTSTTSTDYNSGQSDGRAISRELNQLTSDLNSMHNYALEYRETMYETWAGTDTQYRLQYPIFIDFMDNYDAYNLNEVVANAVFVPDLGIDINPVNGDVYLLSDLQRIYKGIQKYTARHLELAGRRFDIDKVRIVG